MRQIVMGLEIRTLAFSIGDEIVNQIIYDILYLVFNFI